MEITAYYKNVHITPKKLRFMLEDIKKMKPSQALQHLYYSPKKGAEIFYKAIKSAVDSARYTLKTNEDMLQFKLLTVEQGNKLKRFRPGGRGTAKSYAKKFAHIKIILTAQKITPVEIKKELKPVEKKLLPIKSDKKEISGKKTTVRKKKIAK